MSAQSGADYRAARDVAREERAQPQRVAAAMFLAGAVFVAVAILAFWLILPAAGATLTLAAGAGLMVLGYGAIAGRSRR